MRKILVAGGCGFLGSHLCERLISEGHSVICVDNAVTGSWNNVAPLKNHAHFKTLNHDISTPLDVEGEIHEIYHLASPASPVQFEQRGVEILRANALGTDYLLQLAAKKQARFLLASTSEVYGDPKVHPQPEDYWGNVNPVGIRSPYDESKRYAEAFTTAFCRRHQLPYAIARIFNTYGPRMALRDGRVIVNFVGQALVGEPVTVYGDGSQTRSFCYVSDLIDGLMKLMAAAPGMPVNIGSQIEISVKEVAQIVCRTLQSKSSIEFLPLPANDPKVRRPDTTRAKSLLGWEARTTFAEGLSKTIDYFRTQVKSADVSSK